MGNQASKLQDQANDPSTFRHDKPSTNPTPPVPPVNPPVPPDNPPGTAGTDGPPGTGNPPGPSIQNQMRQLNLMLSNLYSQNFLQDQGIYQQVSLHAM